VEERGGVAAQGSPRPQVWGKAKIRKTGERHETKHPRPDAGKLYEVKGKIKEEIGKATNDPNLEVSGKAEKKDGKVQKWIGRAEKAVGE
jgi:uncharacterized protein YjbJ (UPF0337 family)